MKTIEDFSLTNAVLKKLYVDQIIVGAKSQDLSRVLKKHPKLVVVLNHGSMMGALAGLIGVTDMFQRNCGSDRVPFGITWRTFYQLPLSKQVFSYLTQVNKGLNFDDANQLLSDSEFTDCFIMPEGELCNFGNGLDIQPFLSPRFVELAIKNNVPVLIAVHLGSEQWARTVAVNENIKPLFNWLPENMKECFDKSGTLSVPKLFRRKLKRLYMSFALYTPSITEWELSENTEERKRQLGKESDKVRLRMQQMLEQLQSERRGHTAAA